MTSTRPQGELNRVHPPLSEAQADQLIALLGSARLDEMGERTRSRLLALALREDVLDVLEAHLLTETKGSVKQTSRVLLALARARSRDA